MTESIASVNSIFEQPWWLDAVCLPEATWSLKNFTLEQYKALFAKVKAGTITIDNDPTGAETKTYSNVTVDFVR